MITRAKISAVRASGVRRLLTFLSQMQRLFEVGAYSSKYGICVLLFYLRFTFFYFRFAFLFAFYILICALLFYLR